ncbi:MAG: ACT domain-containing protein [Pirellulaceae bacterium]|nr:ACT domain-containing protein [Pirellulaceae bacterium]
MKVLVADKFQKSGIERLQELGCQVLFLPDCSAQDMPQAIAEHQPDILIVRGTNVTSAAIDAARRLRLIVRAGAGVDSIAVNDASRQGIFVANCPGKNAVAVAELAWGLILACDRRIAEQTIDLRAGKWRKGEYSKARGLKGRRLGIIGTGQIGLEIAARGKAFDMEVAAWSRSLTPEKAEALEVGFAPSLVDLVRISDVISVNVAATPETEHLINEEVIAAIRPGTIFVNTSRGSVVDQVALTQAVKDRDIRVGLDVFADEPNGNSADFTQEITQLFGFVGSHHVGASTDQAQDAIAEETIRIVRKFLQTGDVCNCVNLSEKTPATSLLTVRHQNRPGVLAHIFEIVGDAGINVEEMENIIYDGAEAACARIQLGSPLQTEQLDQIQANQHVLAVDQKSLVTQV